MDLFWPDLETEAVGNNLHHTLHFSRGSLEVTPSNTTRYLQLQGDMLALMERCGWTPRPSRRPPPLVAAYRAAIELYAGELLPEDCYEEWTQERRAELRRTYLELLAGLHEKREEYEPAIEVLRLAVSEEPRFGPVTLQTEIILQLPDHPLYELPFAGSPGAGGCGPCPLGAVMRRRRHEGPVPL
jgi:two-component SAPR family response regulator